MDFVFPPRCPLCGQAVGGQGVGGQTGVCADCWGELVIPGEPCCERCCRPFGNGVSAGSVCAPCLADPPRHGGIAAATLYNEASRKLVLAFKHGNRLGLSELMARLMVARLDRWDGAQWLIVPVPLHRWRLWRRGYNQAAVLATQMALMTSSSLAIDALQRRRATASLGGLGRLARRRELSGAIRISSRGRTAVQGRRVLLVDDVLTSGATSDACVSALLRAGAETVVIACFARVVAETPKS